MNLFMSLYVSNYVFETALLLYFSNVDLALEKVVQLHYHYHLNTKLMAGMLLTNQVELHYLQLT